MAMDESTDVQNNNLANIRTYGGTGNKSVASLPSIPANGKVPKGCWAPHEQPKVNVHDTFSNFHVTNSRKLHPEHEEEQFKKVLNVRQGGIRKNKPDSKAKAKHQMLVRMQNSDMALTLLSDKDLVSKVEESRKGDFSETENEHGVLESPMRRTLKVKKLRQKLTRISQNLERRGLMQAVEPLLAVKQENKLPNDVIRYGKEGTKASMPDFRRSRSSPRGKFTILP